MNYILHSENFDHIRFRGGYLKRLLERRAEEIAESTTGLTDPDISVVIRTKNDIGFIKTLFADIAAQEFGGKVEIILVDTESSDGTAEFAVSKGATVIPIRQAEFSYPKALNLGFGVAKHPYVLTIVGHSNLSNTMTLKAVTKWSQGGNLGGIFDFPLPNRNASWAERMSTAIGHARYLTRPKTMKRPSMGMLGANCAVVSREAWETVGHYDETYGAGGEDAALASKILATGRLIVREPVCSVYHSHGLGALNLLRQFRYWQRIAKPLPFVAENLHKWRPDLRRK